MYGEINEQVFDYIVAAFLSRYDENADETQRHVILHERKVVMNTYVYHWRMRKYAFLYKR
jgi:hypothetical protein